MKRLLVGAQAVSEALRGAPAQVSVVYLARGASAEVASLARQRNVAIQERSSEELAAFADGARHDGVIGIAGEYPYASLDELLDRAGDAPLFVALDQIQDPHNFGAIVRSAVAFGADAIITLKDRAVPVTPVVVRASAGATERAHIARVTNLARTLKQLGDQGFTRVGLDAEGTQSIGDVPFGVGRVLVIGSEGEGLRRLTRDSCDVLARIDMPGGFESLNASVAASIALYESARARQR